MRRLLFALLALGVMPLGATGAGAADLPVLPTRPLLGINGRYALPTSTPTQLVVFGHGYTNSSASWVKHLADAAAHGAVAVAPDYRGLGPAPGYRGWPARAGGEDLVTAAQFFLRRCPSIRQVYLLGVSMGGNMSGLALAANAARPDGTRPLFDYWVDVEGVTNWIEEYALASAAAATGSSSGVHAKADIEAETGGTPASVPTEYLDRNVVNHATDIAASKVRGVVVVHGVEDGEVPSDQSDEMTAALRLNAVPTDLYSVLRRTQARDPGHDQTTILSDANAGESDPFAGHGWEGSNTHIVIATGLQRMYALMNEKALPADNAYFVDGVSGTVPAAADAAAPALRPTAVSPCTASAVEAASLSGVAPAQPHLPDTAKATPPFFLVVVAAVALGLGRRRRRGL